MNIPYMNLLAGSPIKVGNACAIYPLTLKEIVEIGEDQYERYLSPFLFKKDDIALSNFDDDSINKIKEMNDYELFFSLCLSDPVFLAGIFDSLKIFTKENKIDLNPNGFFFFGELSEERFIGKDDFQFIKEVIKHQNYLNGETKKEFNPYNDKARELIEKAKRVKEKLRKKNKENGLNLSDIISIVAAHSEGINILDIWNITVYQLYELYIRLTMWDDYHNKFMLLPHVEGDKLKLKHWADKAKK